MKALTLDHNFIYFNPDEIDKDKALALAEEFDVLSTSEAPKIKNLHVAEVWLGFRDKYAASMTADVLKSHFGVDLHVIKY